MRKDLYENRPVNGDPIHINHRPAIQRESLWRKLDPEGPSYCLEDEPLSGLLSRRIACGLHLAEAIRATLDAVRAGGVELIDECERQNLTGLLLSGRRSARSHGADRPLRELERDRS